MDNLKIIFADVKVKGGFHSPGMELAYWLEIVGFLDSSIAEGQRERLSRHVFSLLGNGVRRVLLTCLTDAVSQGFHYKPSRLLKGLLY